MSDQPRLRMFAGPNGSGKTTVKNGLHRSAAWFGTYINPDEIEKELRSTGRLAVTELGLPVATATLQRHFRQADWFLQGRTSFNVDELAVEQDAIYLPAGNSDSYAASVLADYLRKTAIEASKSFSFETVMSSRDKVDLLSEARSKGYRTYLYYIATEDPEINVARVSTRVAEGGHDVPRDKIIARYYRSIDLLSDAIRHVNRGFLFDTSGEQPLYFAEVTDGSTIDLKCEELPLWFAPIWDSFDQPRQ